MKVIPLNRGQRVAARVADEDAGAEEPSRAMAQAQAFVRAAKEAAADLAVTMFFADAPAAEQRLLRNDLLL